MSTPVRDAIVALVAIVLILSGIGPVDRLTWVLEIFWVVVAILIYPFFRTKHRPTTLLFALLALHALVLIYGGHYTYEQVPLGNWLKPLLHTERNHYDRIGHFFQGFVPALLAREVLLRNRVVARRGWLPVLVMAICLAFSGAFELFEWTSALVFGDGSTAYLATQGDQWDAQKDMLCAVIGAIVALATLSRTHDQQLIQS